MESEAATWLNAEFVEKMLRKSEKDESIRVDGVSVKPATDKGDNYSSEMHRVAVNFTRLSDGKQIAETISIIVKVPIDGSFIEKLGVSGMLFDTEIAMMSNTLVEMNRLLGTVTPFCARVLHAQREKPMRLVVEDLAPLGFRMADRGAGLDLAHSLLAIRNIAKFHASSVALYEKDPQAARNYKKGMFHEDYADHMKLFCDGGTKSLGEEVAKWPELGPRYSEKILKLSTTMYDIAKQAAALKEDDFNVINHGDFWVNNMLFRYDNQGKPIDHIFVDFQICVYTSPAVDLLYFMNTSLSDELYHNSQELLLREYHSTLTSTMLQLDCSTPAPSYEKLTNSLEERAICGLLASFTVLPIVLIEKSEVKSMDELLGGNGEYNNPGYQGKRYRNVMLRLLPLYEKRGLLDV